MSVVGGGYDPLMFVRACPYKWATRGRGRPRVMAVMALASWIFGCQPNVTSLEAFRESMPPRPPELRRLDALAGAWETEGTVWFIGMDEPTRTTGSSDAVWTCDRRFLLDRSEYDMGPLGPMTGINVWGWDAQRDRFTFSWFDSFGESATGHAHYDERDGTWRIHTRGQSTRCSVKNKGTIRVVDENTLEWSWETWSAWGFPKYAEYRGISRRR